MRGSSLASCPREAAFQARARQPGQATAFSTTAASLASIGPTTGARCSASTLHTGVGHVLVLDLSPALRPRPVASEAHPRLHCETGRRLNSCSYSSARVALEAGAWRSALGVCSSIDSFVRIEAVSLLLRRQFSEFCFKGDTTIDAQKVVAESRRKVFCAKRE